MPYTTKVLLRGELGKRFGREWNLALDRGTPLEAVNAITRQRPGFRKWVQEAAQEGIGLRVLIGGRDVTHHTSALCEQLLDGQPQTDLNDLVLDKELMGVIEQDLTMPCGRDSIEFVPEPAAAGIGLGIYAAAHWIVNFLAVWGTYIVAGAAVLSAGYSVYATRQAQKAGSRAPGIRADDYHRAELADQVGAFSFAGAVNKRGQGKPLPVLYGRGIIGSHIGSFGIQSVRNRKTQS